MMDRRNDYDYNDELEDQSPSPNIANNANLRAHEDNLFHLQQELLRQELPKNQWREIRQNQSQRLEQFLAREEQMWAQRSNSRGGNKRRQDSFNEGLGGANARRQRMSEPGSDGFTSISMDDNANRTMGTGSMGGGQRVGGSFSFGTNDQYNYNNHFLGSSHLDMTNTLPSNGMSSSDAENFLNGMNADSNCFDISNNLMSNTTSRHHTSTRRSPVDNPFGFDAMQQQQNNNWQNNNQSNSMNSINDRTRSVGSNPAPFVREMGSHGCVRYRNSSRAVTEDPNSFGVEQQLNFNGQGSSQVQQFSFQQRYGQADHQQGGLNNSSNTMPPPSSPMGDRSILGSDHFVNVTLGSSYGTMETGGTGQNQGGSTRSILGADNFFGGKSSSSAYNVDRGIQRHQYYGQQASPAPRPARALSPYTLRLQQSMMSQQQQGSRANHAASSTSASSSNNLEAMPPQERDPTPILDLTQPDSFKKCRGSGSSSQMLLQMLSDTVMMSPANAKQVLTFSQPQQQHQSFPHLPSACTTSRTSIESLGEGDANNIGKVAYAMRDSDLLPMSPFTTYTKPTVLNNEEQVSPTPLDHTKVGVDQIGGDTPTLFSSYFLANNIGGAGQDNGLDVNNMPPPPLVQTKPSPKPSATTKTPEETKPPPAVPLKKKTVHKQQPQQGSSASSQGGKKKPKTKKSKDKPPKKEKTPPDTSNHIVTPSSAIISGIAAEIRSQMASSAQEQPTETSATATMDETPSGNGTASAASYPCENSTKGPNGLSIPQFASAMEATQASQQAIHDWDRKFGLRRAHSKTMRESCRSRKRVLEFLKGEGANLMLLNKYLTSSMNEDAAAEVAAAVAVEASASRTSNSSITQEDEGAYAQQDDGKVKASEAVEGMEEFMKTLGNGDMVEQTKPSCVEELEGEHTSSRKLPTSLGSLYLQNETSSAKLTMKPSPPTSKQPGHESKVDDHLERMFRRTSIECVAPILPFVPPPREADRKQYHARGA